MNAAAEVVARVDEFRAALAAADRGEPIAVLGREARQEVDALLHCVDLTLERLGRKLSEPAEKRAASSAPPAFDEGAAVAELCRPIWLAVNRVRVYVERNRVLACAGRSLFDLAEPGKGDPNDGK